MDRSLSLLSIKIISINFMIFSHFTNDFLPLLSLFDFSVDTSSSLVIYDSAKYIFESSVRIYNFPQFHLNLLSNFIKF